MEKVRLWREKIERRLREVFRAEGPAVLVEAMSYYLFQEGKRIRPLLTVAVTDSLGGDPEDAITVGCVIEMVHNYSLIHDDLPAMDDDDFRRGLPTCHRKFGEAVAILAGDALLTYAFEVLLDPSNFRSLSADRLLRIARTLAVKAGSSGLVVGQVLDVRGESDPVEVDMKKTGALFEACFLCGGILSGRDDLLGDLEEAGRLTGLLFQVTDDILDRDGVYEVFGERGSREEAERLYRKAVAKVSHLLGKNSEVLSIIDRIYSRIT
ncbi:MAG: polyprenyl synthetase family protein [Aquificota bacterium]|nr:polyprenyl synthetase family protein [Aquificota bacterium]